MQETVIREQVRAGKAVISHGQERTRTPRLWERVAAPLGAGAGRKNAPGLAERPREEVGTLG